MFLENVRNVGVKYFSDEVMSCLEKIAKAREIARRYMSLIIILKKLHKVLSFIQSTLCIRISQESAGRFIHMSTSVH